MRDMYFTYFYELFSVALCVCECVGFLKKRKVQCFCFCLKEKKKEGCCSHDIEVFLPFLRNVAKMDDAKVEIDDGKDENVVPDTMYQ